MYPTHDVAILSPSIDLPQQQKQQHQPLNIKFSVWHTFKHHIPRFLITIIIDVILPLVIYIHLQKYIRPVFALLIAGSPPLFMVIFKAIWLCTFDALGFLVFFSFAVTALVAVISRNPIILLLEKSLITGVLSFIFGITLIPFRCLKQRCRWRPMAYYFYQDLVPTKRKDVGLPDNLFSNENEQIDNNYVKLKEEVTIERVVSHKQEVAQVYEWLYLNCKSFRLSCKLITSIWSMGYLMEFLVRMSLILAHFSVNQIVIYGHIILSLITVLMILFTVICITIERKYTLAFIDRWRIEYYNTQQCQQRRSSDLSYSIVIVNSDSNCILSVNA
ncbi:unnamed protein product [Adineta steineri]|uniref:Uncharacterized protein n=1 Tax=Adineta steineri TaxID=433720 RepID=A0A813QK96_9BILA|nr:unnamed protein product [Adineta steineri]CAF0768334.1 unnamed protein product [Adineta steineri]CAF3502985.1 unnamed protein product [Adineta steineri]CAF3991887.1 unnamed protein product [Adineta steineri]